MLFFALAFIWVGRLHSFRYTSPSSGSFSSVNRVGSRIHYVYASQFDKEMVELDQLSRSELQSLAKEYGIKATGKTADLIEQLGLSIASIRSDADLLLPSKEQTLKVSQLEKTVTLDSSAAVPSYSKYGVENSNLDIQEILKDQGVRIDDLIALRDSLMKGGFKFNNEEDEGDFEDSEEQLSDEDIDREFYGENNEFGRDSNPFPENIKKKEIQSKIGSSKTAADAMEQEEERSAANKLKSKAIKEAKLLLKLEGKSTKLVRKVEVKLKPQSETTGYTSGYVKKPAVSSSSYDKIKQQQRQVQKEYEDKQVLNAIIESFQSVKITDNNEGEEFVESLDAKKISSTVNQAMKSERKPVKSIVARTTDSVSTGSPVYVKLKRREESYDDEEEEEEEEKRNFSSLEALDDRMDELYGELDSKSEFPVPVDLSPKIPVASYNDGSDSKNPIKWRNGRLVSDKDRFFESMKANAESELELELEMNGNRSEKTENNESENNNEKSGENKKKISALPVNKKIVVELTGVTMKKMLEHLEVSIGFEGLYEETNLRCFAVKPSITSSLKVLRQAPLEWARKKIEYLYIQSMKRL